MKTVGKLSLFFINFVFFILPSLSYCQEIAQQKSASTLADSVEGVIVCINEEMAALRHSKPMCDKYGHLFGLKTSDGMIWSFIVNPVGKELRENEKNVSKKVKVWGRMFYNAKIIEVKNYKLIENKRE